MEIKEIETVISTDKHILKVLYFSLENNAECEQMSDVVEEIIDGEDYEDVRLIEVPINKMKPLADKLKVISAPSFLFYMDGEVDRLVGADAPSLVKKIQFHAEKSRSLSSEALNARLHSLINKSPCMLFMKGNPETPRCGFSKQTIALLHTLGAKFETFDILEDYDVREGLKKYSNWPTFPQLYIKGELVGGLDILKELHENGELADMLSAADNTKDLDSKLKRLISQSDVMVFMKGSPEQPRCGFSRTLMDILKKTNVKFDTFDILTDQEVREGLKVFSKWPTFPQIYVKGSLIGGLDIIKEMDENDELKAALKGE